MLEYFVGPLFAWIDFVNIPTSKLKYIICFICEYITISSKLPIINYNSLLLERSKQMREWIILNELKHLSLPAAGRPADQIIT